MNRRVEVCSKCLDSFTGLEQNGFLIPLWVEKENCSKDLPHGPKIFNIEKKQCWLCSMSSGDNWHR